MSEQRNTDGWFHKPADYPLPSAELKLARIREALASQRNLSDVLDEIEVIVKEGT